jgi:hypothetical protein
LVEQRIENPRVGGSIPPPATIKYKHLASTSGWGFLLFWLDKIQRWASDVLQGIFFAKSVIGGQWQ